MANPKKYTQTSNTEKIQWVVFYIPIHMYRHVTIIMQKSDHEFEKEWEGVWKEERKEKNYKLCNSTSIKFK